MRISLVLSTFVIACSAAPSGIDVIIDADQEVALRSSRILLEVRTQEGDVALQETFNVEQNRFPIRRLISPRGGDVSRVVTVTARAANSAGDTLTTARIIRSFVAGRTVEVRLRLYELCLGTNCPEGLTCEPQNGDAECVDARIIDIRDAGNGDGGVSDGSNQCISGFQRCGEICVPVNTPNACGPSCTVCPSDSRGTALCNDGQCSTVCNQGTELCETSDGSRCIDTQTDPEHCGTCANVCPGEQLCVSGTCVEPPSCDVNNPASCTGVTHCNASTNRCAAGCDPRLSNQCGSNQTCSNNQCECASGTHDCSGVCVNSSSVNSCGQSCTPCALAANATQMGCDGGSCIVVSCTGGYQPSGDQRSCLTSPNTPSWRQATTTGVPPARSAHAMVYDRMLNRVVLFGGDNGRDYLGDTWAFSGDTWSQIIGPGPLARYGHAMVYDSALNRVVLFGGSDGSSRLSDSWVLTGTTWSQITGPAPSARFAHAMVYDSTLNRVVLFGGSRDSTYLGDTWVLSGTTWSQITAPGPSARFAPAMVYDSTLNRVVLFGGVHESRNHLSDTWVLSDTTWTQISGPGPSERYNHAMVYDSTLNRVVLFGGDDGRALSDTWSLSGSTWSEVTGPAPSARSDHAMVFDSTLRRVVLFGGHAGRALSDTWVRE